MNICTRRNAVVGYLALQALKRARRNARSGTSLRRERAHARTPPEGGLRVVALRRRSGSSRSGSSPPLLAIAAKRRPSTARRSRNGREASAAEEAVEAVGESVPADAGADPRDVSRRPAGERSVADPSRAGGARPVRAGQAGRGGSARARARARRQARLERGPVRARSPRRRRRSRARRSSSTAIRTEARGGSARRSPSGTASASRR